MRERERERERERDARTHIHTQMNKGKQWRKFLLVQQTETQIIYKGSNFMCILFLFNEFCQKWVLLKTFYKKEFPLTLITIIIFFNLYNC